jgi:hypothetical protein
MILAYDRVQWCSFFINGVESWGPATRLVLVRYHEIGVWENIK